MIGFVDGVDSFQLRGGVTFSDLTITQFGTNTTISLTSSSELLATLISVNSGLIDSTDFVAV